MKLSLQFIANRDDVLVGHLKLFRHWGRQFAFRRGLAHEAADFAAAATAYGVEALSRFDNRPIKFATFARAYVERSLLRESHRQTFARAGLPADLDQFREERASDTSPANVEADDDPPELKSLHPKTRLVASLVLQGFRPHQIAEQTGLAGKEVAFLLRQAVKMIERRREELAGPSLFDEVCDAVGAEEIEPADSLAG